MKSIDYYIEGVSIMTSQKLQLYQLYSRLCCFPYREIAKDRQCNCHYKKSAVKSVFFYGSLSKQTCS